MTSWRRLANSRGADDHPEEAEVFWSGWCGRGKSPRIGACRRSSAACTSPERSLGAAAGAASRSCAAYRAPAPSPSPAHRWRRSTLRVRCGPARSLTGSRSPAMRFLRRCSRLVGRLMPRRAVRSSSHDHCRCALKRRWQSAHENGASRAPSVVSADAPRSIGSAGRSSGSSSSEIDEATLALARP